MAAAISDVDNLGASYDTLNKGTQLVVTTTTEDIISFTYMLTPGANVDGNAYDNSFITKTLLVGSDAAVKIGGTSPSFKYLLFIEEDETLCADDFYVIVSARNAGGASLYTEPEAVYLTPIAPTVTSAVLDRTSSSGYEDGVLTVTLAADVTCGKDVKMYFIVQFQEVGQTGYAVKRLGPATQVGSTLQYTQLVDGLDQYGIVDESLWVALQAVRVIDGTTEASSDLSNTVQATDSEEQLPPVNLSIDYQFNTGPNGTTDVTFNNPPTYQIITPATFNIYKQINVYEGDDLLANVIGEVDYDPLKGTIGDYLFQDVSANLDPTGSNLPLNSTITYWATAVDASGNESAPSNSASDSVVVPSSKPENLRAVALINTDGTPESYSDGYTTLSITFTSPTDIEGETNDVYNLARYEVTVTSDDTLINYTSDRGDWLYADYQGEGVQHTFDFPDGELSECTENAVLTYTIRLITSKGAENGNDNLVGVVNSETVVANTRPVITDINGEIGNDNFTRTGLQSFKVYYFGTLVPPGVSLLMETTGTEPQLEIVKGALMQTGFDVVPDGYYRYAGAYERTYTLSKTSVTSGKQSLLITACNQSGFAQTKASD